MKRILLSIILMCMYSFIFSQITLSVNQQNVSCFGLSDASATITATGGTPAYSYTWMPSGHTSSVATGLPAGQYTVHVQDITTNTNTIVVTITEPTLLTIAVTQTNVSCGGYCDGAINITASGGLVPIAAYLTNVSNVPYIPNLCAGNYSCSVINTNGCTASQTVTITQPAFTLSTSITYTNASCNGTCDGILSINPTGGVAPYTFSSQPFAITNSTTSNLCAGIYTIVTTDANGCSFMNSVYVTNTGNTTLPNSTITSTSYHETCYLSGDGSIDLTITGTNPGPFVYNWSNGATTQDISNISSNTYWVTITDGSLNCVTIQNTINSVGVNCGTISGNVFADNNSDCLNNIGDNNFQNILVTVNPGNRLGYTNLNGDYIVNDLPYGTYSVTLANYIPTCTSILNATVSAVNPNSINNTLSLGISSVQPDINTWAYSNGIVPGFVCRVNYYLNNSNYFNGNGLYKIVLPSAFITNITNISPSTYTISADTVLWNFSNVVYGNVQNFYVDFTTPLTTPLSSIFNTCMWASPAITDLNYSNNTSCYSRIVTGSFDPNDKTVSPVGIGSNGDISATETDLTYLIRFQNTGNGPAVNIMIKDTLSPNIDITTLEMLGSSHNYNIEILSGNILKWKFNNIMLPDSNSNESASHGYIQYRIKRNNNNVPGIQIKNTAYIYFDFNDPVITNTAINTIETTTGIKAQFGKEDKLFIYPNPVNDVVNFRFSNILEKRKVELYDALGIFVLEKDASSNNLSLTTDNLQSGIYFYHILLGDKTIKADKIVIIK